MKCSVKKTVGTQLRKLKLDLFISITRQYVELIIAFIVLSRKITFIRLKILLSTFSELKLNRAENKLLLSASNSHQGESNNFKCWINNQDMVTLQQVFGTKACHVWQKPWGFAQTQQSHWNKPPQRKDLSLRAGALGSVSATWRHHTLSLPLSSTKSVWVHAL